MATEAQDWRGQSFRKKVITQIEEALRQAGNPIIKTSIEMENHVFQKAKSREEYLALVARLILHIKDINTQKEKKAAMAAASGLNPAHGMHPGTNQLQQQQQQNTGMQDPINALQNLARQGGGLNLPMGHQPQQVMLGVGQGTSDQPLLSQQLQSFLMEQRGANFNQRTVGMTNQQQLHQKLMHQRALQQHHQQQQQQQHQQQQQQQHQQLIQQRALQQQQHQGQVPTLQRQDAFIVTSPQQPTSHIPPQQGQVPQNAQMQFAAPGPYPSPQSHFGQSPVGQPIPNPQQMAPSPAQQPVSLGHMIHSPANPLPSPQSHIVPSPASKTIGVPSPGTNLNTPGNPGSVGPIPSPASRAPGEDQAYLDKLKQLSKYIEPLRRMVNRIDKDEDRKKDQLSKMKNLLDILSDSSRRLPMATLLKCELVLEKLDLYPKGPQSLPTQMSKSSEQHMCQPLLDTVASLLQSPMLNHTLHRTFGPAMMALNGSPIRAHSPIRRKRKRDSESSDDEIPDVLQGEVARLDGRFRVSLHPAYSPASKTIHLMCHLEDKNLPSVPPIQIAVPDGYPGISPSCDTQTVDYETTGFLQTVHKQLSNRLLKMPDRFSLTALLNTWEMTVRQACNPSAAAQ